MRVPARALCGWCVPWHAPRTALPAPPPPPRRHPRPPYRAPPPHHPPRLLPAGWGALGPVAIFFEYVLGIRADVPGGKLVWDIRQLERHGVRRYPFGAAGLLDLECEPRASVGEAPIVRISSSMPITVVLRWGKGAATTGGVAPNRTGVPRAPMHEHVVKLIAESSTEVRCSV